MTNIRGQPNLDFSSHLLIALCGVVLRMAVNENTAAILNL